MKALLIITGLVLFAESINLFQLFHLTTITETSNFYFDPEAEEEKKAEPEGKKIEKQHHFLEYSFLSCFLLDLETFSHQAGLCMKGHCAIIDQPPEL